LKFKFRVYDPPFPVKGGQTDEFAAGILGTKSFESVPRAIWFPVFEETKLLGVGAGTKSFESVPVASWFPVVEETRLLGVRAGTKSFESVPVAIWFPVFEETRLLGVGAGTYRPLLPEDSTI
jgi:hypothetical protein